MLWETPLRATPSATFPTTETVNHVVAQLVSYLMALDNCVARAVRHWVYKRMVVHVHPT